MPAPVKNSPACEELRRIHKRLARLVASDLINDLDCAAHVVKAAQLTEAALMATEYHEAMDYHGEQERAGDDIARTYDQAHGLETEA